MSNDKDQKTEESRSEAQRSPELVPEAGAGFVAAVVEPVVVDDEAEEPLEPDGALPFPIV